MPQASRAWYIAATSSRLPTPTRALRRTITTHRCRHIPPQLLIAVSILPCSTRSMFLDSACACTCTCRPKMKLIDSSPHAHFHLLPHNPLRRRPSQHVAPHLELSLDYSPGLSSLRKRSQKWSSAEPQVRPANVHPISTEAGGGGKQRLFRCFDTAVPQPNLLMSSSVLSCLLPQLYLCMDGLCGSVRNFMPLATETLQMSGFAMLMRDPFVGFPIPFFLP